MLAQVGGMAAWKMCRNQFSVVEHCTFVLECVDGWAVELEVETAVPARVAELPLVLLRRVVEHDEVRRRENSVAVCGHDPHRRPGKDHERRAASNEIRRGPGRVHRGARELGDR